MSPGGWLPARVVRAVKSTPHGTILTLDVPGWTGSLPGQHLDVRLTAEDGYQAERSYSLASSGEGRSVELGVDAVPGGEVSPYLVHEAEPGDEFEVKGPLGGYFVWDAADPAPVQLVAGGSGIVPLLAIARARTSSGPPMRLLYSVRGPGDALYRDEVERLPGKGIDVSWVHTREGPAGGDGPIGRLTTDTLAALTVASGERPTVFVCGPTGFVETVADGLVGLGHEARRVLTERFGGA